MELAIFLLLAGVALASAIAVVVHRNPVSSTMALVVTLVTTAGLFLMLGSPFLAALQILLYTGAILVLFLFVIMLLNVQRERASHARASGLTWGAAICAAVLAGAVMRLFWAAYADTPTPPLEPEKFSLHAVAGDLFSTYLLPFEIIGLLLLVAVVAASWVAKRPAPGEPGATLEETRGDEAAAAEGSK
jgi:NADH-quinone oxidoreductase subunit J